MAAQGTPNWYKRLLAWGMAKGNAADEDSIQLKGCPHESMAQLKQTLFADLSGTVVEIGPGAGTNLSYYPRNVRWIGIEPNPFMHPHLKQEAERLGLQNLELRQGSAEQLNLEANSVDAVVSTYVLCSVDNLAAALQEIRRVLKPGGRFLFIEHVAAECGTWTRRVQNGVEPAWKILFDGCHPNRETGLALEEAGFEKVEYQHFQIAFPVVSPHIAGSAIAKSSTPDMNLAPSTSR